MREFSFNAAMHNRTFIKDDYTLQGSSAYVGYILLCYLERASTGINNERRCADGFEQLRDY